MPRPVEEESPGAPSQEPSPPTCSPGRRKSHRNQERRATGAGEGLPFLRAGPAPELRGWEKGGVVWLPPQPPDRPAWRSDVARILTGGKSDPEVPTAAAFRAALSVRALQELQEPLLGTAPCKASSTA